MWWVLRFGSVGTGLSFAAGTPVSPLARPGSTLACGDRQFPRRRRFAPVITLSDGTGGGRDRQARYRRVVLPRGAVSCSHAERCRAPTRSGVVLPRGAVSCRPRPGPMTAATVTLLRTIL